MKRHVHNGELVLLFTNNSNLWGKRCTTQKATWFILPCLFSLLPLVKWRWHPSLLWMAWIDSHITCYLCHILNRFSLIFLEKAFRRVLHVLNGPYLPFCCVLSYSGSRSVLQVMEIQLLLCHLLSLSTKNWRSIKIRKSSLSNLQNMPRQLTFQLLIHTQETRYLIMGEALNYDRWNWMRRDAGIFQP